MKTPELLENQENLSFEEAQQLYEATKTKQKILMYDITSLPKAKRDVVDELHNGRHLLLDGMKNNLSSLSDKDFALVQNYINETMERTVCDYILNNAKTHGQER